MSISAFRSSNSAFSLSNKSFTETSAVVIFLVLCWWLLYLFVVVISRQESEWCCRLVTFIHGCIITYLTLHDIHISGLSLEDKQITPLNERQKVFLEISFSYFIFDLTWMHIFGSETELLWVHHLTSLFLISKMMYSNIGGAFVSYGLAGLEGTNPYLQLRWFLRSYGCNNTPIHSLVELWFMLLFVVIRAVGGTYLIYWVELHPKLDLVCKISCILMYCISWLLIYQIITYFGRKYVTKRFMHSPSVASMFPYARTRRTMSLAGASRQQGHNQ